MRAARLSLFLIVPLLLPFAVAAKQAGYFEREASRLSQGWSEYTQRREKRALVLRGCREQATAQRVAQTDRAEYVHRCARAR
jgi:hypothetical protein